MVFYRLGTISNHMDGDSSVGVPLVPKCRHTGERVTS